MPARTSHRDASAAWLLRCCLALLAVLAAAAIAAALPAGAGAMVPGNVDPVPTGPGTLPVAANKEVFASARVGSKVYLGGNFTQLGPRTGHIARFTGGPVNGTTGRDADSGLPEVAGGNVKAITHVPGIGWFVGGTFTHIGPYPRDGLALINDDLSMNPWAPVVTGTDHSVNAIVQMASGYVAIGGNFATVDAQHGPVVLVDTSASHSVYPTSLPAGGVVEALAPSGPGMLAVGGSGLASLNQYLVNMYVSGGGTGAPGSILLDTTSTLSAIDGPVHALASVPGCSLFVGGSFSAQLVTYDWGTMNLGTPNSTLFHHPTGGAGVTALAVAPGLPNPSTPDVYVGGDFTNVTDGATNTAVNGLYRLRYSAGYGYDSSFNATLPVGGNNATIRALAVSPGGEVYAGGTFTWNPLDERHLLAFKPGGAMDVTRQPSDPVNTLALDTSGVLGPETLYVGGDFTVTGGVRANHLAAYDTVSGNIDTSLHAGVTGGSVYALYVSPTQPGRLYVGGNFTDFYDGQPKVISRNVAIAVDLASGTVDQSWNPTLPTAPSPSVRAITGDGSNVYLGGSILNGLNQTQLVRVQVGTNTPSVLTTLGGGAGTSPVVNALGVTNGGIAVGGDFTQVGGTVANAHNLALVGADGSFRADLNTDKPVFAIAASGGKLFAGGSFSLPHALVAGWSTQSAAPWATSVGFDPGMVPGAGNVVRALDLTDDNTDLVVGGTFPAVGAGQANLALVSTMGSGTAAVAPWAHNLYSADVYTVSAWKSSQPGGPPPPMPPGSRTIVAGGVLAFQNVESSSFVASWPVNTRPTVPAGLTMGAATDTDPGVNVVTNDPHPHLTMTANDPDGTAVGYAVQMADASPSLLVDYRSQTIPGGTAYTYTVGDATGTNNQPLLTAGLPDGTYTWKAWSIDSMGVNSALMADGPGTITVDTTPPVGTVSVAVPPVFDPGYVAGSVTISFTAGDGAGTGVANAVMQVVQGANASQQCARPAGMPTWSCTLDTALLQDGPVQLQLHVVDKAGNSFDTTPVSYTVDNHAPNPPAVTSITTMGPHLWLDTGSPKVWFQPSLAMGESFSVAASATDGVNVSALAFPNLLAWTGTASTSLAGPTMSGTGTYTLSGTGGGPETGTINATDSTGFVSSTPFSTAPDGLAPVTSISGVPRYLNSGSATYTATATDGTGSGLATSSVTLHDNDTSNDTPAPGCGTFTTSPASCSLDTTAISDGNYSVVVTAVDHVGNTDAGHALPLTVDTLAPAQSASIAGTTGQPGLYLDPGGALAWYAPTPAATYNIAVATSASDPSTPFGQPGSGLAKEQVAGPPAPINHLSTGAPAADAATINVPFLGSFAGGMMSVRSFDMAGNQSAAWTFSLAPDGTGPVATFSSPAASTMVAGTLSVTGTLADAGSGTKDWTLRLRAANAPLGTGIVVDSGLGGSVSSSVDTLPLNLPDGNYRLDLTGHDMVGNAAPAAVLPIVLNNFPAPAPVQGVAGSAVTVAGTPELTLTWMRINDQPVAGYSVFVNAPGDTTFDAAHEAWVGDINRITLLGGIQSRAGTGAAAYIGLVPGRTYVIRVRATDGTDPSLVGALSDPTTVTVPKVATTMTTNQVNDLGTARGCGESDDKCHYAADADVHVSGGILPLAAAGNRAIHLYLYHKGSDGNWDLARQLPTATTTATGRWTLGIDGGHLGTGTWRVEADAVATAGASDVTRYTYFVVNA